MPGDESYGWIRISHVCHYWRSLALSSPRLWRYIIVRSSDMAKECLSRSQNVPLVVWLFENYPWNGQQFHRLKTLVLQLHRICELRHTVTFDPFDWFPEQMQVSLSAPLLTNLICSSGSATRGHSSMLQLLPALDLPNLSYLEMQGPDRYAWMSQPFPPSLKILRVHVGGGDRPNGGDKVRLGRLDHLESLTIFHHSYDPYPNLDDLESPTPSEFPRLKLLQVLSFSHQLCRYLKFFNLTVSPRIRLATWDDPAELMPILSEISPR